MASANEAVRFRRIAGFEWDEMKRRANLLKHGIDFVDAVKVFSDPQQYTYRSRPTSGERRYVTVGSARGTIIAVISTPRQGKLRIISARAARRTERKLYE